MAKMACGHESLDSWVEDADTRLPYCMECFPDGPTEEYIEKWREKIYDEAERLTPTLPGMEAV